MRSGVCHDWFGIDIDFELTFFGEIESKGCTRLVDSIFLPIAIRKPILSFEQFRFTNNLVKLVASYLYMS